MRVAFYAPLKAPTHPVPSGDRQIARGLVAALEHAGHTVELACTLRTFDAAGDPDRQARLRALGLRAGERAARRLAGARPALWLTYHLYHKAPDWTGPLAARLLRIPYVVAEASYAEKHAGGPWGLGLAGVREALAAARAVIALKAVDLEGVRPWLAPGAELARLAPFLDVGAMAGAAGRGAARAELAARHGLDPGVPWLVSLAMLRPGDKAASYRVLGAALERLLDRSWQLAVIGDGPARAEIEAALGPVAERVRWLGERSATEVRRLLCGFDLCAWPAVGEAIGMALLEAAAAAVPVVSARTGGVAEVVDDGRTGLLVTPGDPAAFAGACGRLLDDAAERRRLGAEGRRTVLRGHGLESAARTLDTLLTGVARESA